MCPLNFHDSLVLVKLILKGFKLSLGHLSLLLHEGWILIIEAETIAFSVLNKCIDCCILLVIHCWPDVVLDILRLLPVYLGRSRFLSLSLY